MNMLISHRITSTKGVPNRMNKRFEIILNLKGVTGVCPKRGGQ